MPRYAQPMLDVHEIADIADTAVRRRVSHVRPERVIAETTTDSTGNEALRITLVLQQNTVNRLTGDEALDLLVAIQNALRIKGEERLPIIQYATESEIQSDLAKIGLQSHDD